MTVCACGRITNGKRPVCDRCSALLALGLTQNATQMEVKDAYRLLAKVWHPDRFQGDEDLRLKAEEKLKEINSAYQVLITTAAADTASEWSQQTSTSSQAEATWAAQGSNGASGKTPPSGWDSTGAARQTRPTAESAAGTDSRVSYPCSVTRHSDASLPRKRRASLAWTVTVVAVLVAGGIWLNVRFGHPSSVNSAAREAAKPLAESPHPQAKGSGAALAADIGQQASKHSQNSKNDLTRPAGKTRAGSATKDATSPRSSLLIYPSDDPQVPYFTVGSTTNDVIRVQGAPSRRTENLFAYGLSEVHFKDGRVESWHVDPSSPLKARMPEQ